MRKRGNGVNYKSDYNKAVFLYAYGNGKPLKQNSEYQRYFEFECGITNPRKYHKDLIKEGYLQLSSDSDILSGLKVSELKEICDSLGLTKTGKKKDLIDKIISSCSSEQIHSFVKESLYSLSEKGLSFMNNNSDYVELHKHKNWDVDLTEYVQSKQTFSSPCSFYDVIWNIFNKRIVEYKKQYNLLRNNYLHMSDLLLEEKKYDESLKYLLYVLFFDVCGVELYEHLKYYDSREEALNLYYFDAFKTIIPKRIYNLSEYFNESFIDQIYSQYKRLPLNLCPKDTFKHLVLDITENNETLDQTYEIVFKSNYENYINKKFNLQECTKPTTKTVSTSSSEKKSSGCLTSVFTFCLLLILINLFI